MGDKYAFVDTNFLIWGVQKKANKRQAEMIERVTACIADKRGAGFVFATCSVCLTEFLRGFPKEEQKKWMDIVARDFYIVPFDIDAARLAAELYKDKIDRMESAYPEDEKFERVALRADVKIAGAVLLFRPDVFVSHDGRLRKWVSPQVVAEDIPELKPTQVQPTLPAFESA